MEGLEPLRGIVMALLFAYWAGRQAKDLAGALCAGSAVALAFVLGVGHGGIYG